MILGTVLSALRDKEGHQMSVLHYEFESAGSFEEMLALYLKRIKQIKKENPSGLETNLDFIDKPLIIKIQNRLFFHNDAISDTDKYVVIINIKDGKEYCLITTEILFSAHEVPKEIFSEIKRLAPREKAFDLAVQYIDKQKESL
jgi:hypothetical protein